MRFASRDAESGSHGGLAVPLHDDPAPRDGVPYRQAIGVPQVTTL